MTTRYLPAILAATGWNANKKTDFFSDSWPRPILRLSPHQPEAQARALPSLALRVSMCGEFQTPFLGRGLESLTFPAGLEILKPHGGSLSRSFTGGNS